MNRILCNFRRLHSLSLFACLAVLSLCVAAVTASAQVSLTQISSDPFTVGPGPARYRS